VIAGLLRPVWEWALWSWRRLGLTVAVLVIAGLAIGRLAQAPGRPSPGHPRPAHPVPVATAPSPAAAAASPQPAGQGGPGLVWAIFAGQQFAAAWVSHTPGSQAQAGKYATAGLAAQLTQAPGRRPVAAVTGPAEVSAQSGQSVTLTVPTTAGVALITVVRSGHGWLASAARLVPTGGR
jgi:hypothetical protein